MIRVLIADDHPVLRRGLKQIVSEQTDMTVVGEVQNGREVLALVRKQPCDVILLDISMPGRSGLDVLKEVKQQEPKLPVVMLSTHPEDQYVIRALKMGASGYITKESAPDTLVTAIRTVVAGGRYVSPALAEKLAPNVATGRQPLPHHTLSDREFQILCMIASGKSTGQIADELALSVSSVYAYRMRVRRRMRMKTTGELTRYAVRVRLLGEPQQSRASHRIDPQSCPCGTYAYA